MHFTQHACFLLSATMDSASVLFLSLLEADLHEIVSSAGKHNKKEHHCCAEMHATHSAFVDTMLDAPMKECQEKIIVCLI